MSNVLLTGLFLVLAAVISGIFGTLALGSFTTRRLSLLQQEMSALKEIPTGMSQVRAVLESSLERNWRAYLLIRHPVGRLQRKRRRLYLVGNSLMWAAIPLMAVALTSAVNYGMSTTFSIGWPILALGLSATSFATGALAIKESVVEPQSNLDPEIKSEGGSEQGDAPSP